MTQPPYMEAIQRQQCSYLPTLLHELDEEPQFEAHRFKVVKELKATSNPNSNQSAERIDEEPTKKAGRGAPRKVRTNALKPYLRGLNSPGHALSVLPQFDHIVTGAVNIDLGNNTRPLSKKLAITLLQRLDVISTKAIQDYMHMTLRSCSVRNAQRYGQCLRVILQAATKVAETQWPPPGEINEINGFRSSNYVPRCGNDACAICSGSPQQDSDWTHRPSSEDAAREDEAEFTEYAETPWNAD